MKIEVYRALWGMEGPLEQQFERITVPAGRGDMEGGVPGAGAARRVPARGAALRDRPL